MKAKKESLFNASLLHAEPVAVADNTTRVPRTVLAVTADTLGWFAAADSGLAAQFASHCVLETRGPSRRR